MICGCIGVFSSIRMVHVVQRKIKPFDTGCDIYFDSKQALHFCLLYEGSTFDVTKENIDRKIIMEY